jgi:DNA-binding GntR family transcriptional regulator
MAQQPMYQQVADDLHTQIESGELAPGDQLPTELELRDRYNSSRNTIRDAIKRLTSQGLVETRPGQGTFFTRSIDPFVTELSSDPQAPRAIAKGASRLLMADNIREGAVRYLAEAIGVRQVGYRDWITARVPDTNEQSFFGITHDVTVFEIFRTGFDQTWTPLRVTVTVWPADRNQFIVNSGDVPDPRYDDSEEPA